MTQIPDKFALNRDNILLASRNGTVPGDDNSSAQSVRSMLSKTFHWFRHPRLSKPGKGSGAAAQSDPLKRINRVLFIFSVILTISLPLLLWKDAIEIEAKMTLPVFPQATGKQPVVKTAMMEKASLVQLASQRQFFVYEETPATVSESAPVNAVEVPGLSQRYSLLGVVMGDKPNAIVRENVSNTSMFLTVGDRLGLYVIKEILADRMILEQDGERFELTM